ncbi:MAG: ferredoxin [Bdellovibrionales bacterium]|nr:ferredoxin [Bdellovibrionales bacterium]
MADKTKRYDENAPGKFYVDRECIACDACALTAPDHFKIDQDDGHAFVTKQPGSEDELKNCQDAMDGCPVEAIGNDGEE